VKLLFVCSRNEWRSPTAEKIFANRQDIEVRSAGTSAKARIAVNEKIIDWADVIFVMEKKHQEILKMKYSHCILKKDIVILNIPDEYKFMDAELVDLLTVCVENYLENI
jgi:predicted protein tyrosine phosphatase